MTHHQTQLAPCTKPDKEYDIFRRLADEAENNKNDLQGYVSIEERRARETKMTEQ